MARLEPSDLAAVGITNQRESTLVWDKKTGKPLHPLIVWNDVRTESICMCVYSYHTCFFLCFWCVRVCVYIHKSSGSAFYA